MSDFLFFKNSEVENRICLEIVTKNGSLFTNMMSPTRVTCWYRDIIGAGIFVYSSGVTGGDVLRMVFPLRDPTSGPKIRSAVMMSSRVTRQSGSK